MGRTLGVASLAVALGGCYNIGVEQCRLACDEASDCPAHYSCNQGLCATGPDVVCEVTAESDGPAVDGDPGPVQGPSPDGAPSLAPDASLPDTLPPDADLRPDADPCQETLCVPVTAAYVSHFTDYNCTGIESYYTPYFNPVVPPAPNPDGIRRSWDGRGVAGTEYHTQRNVSYRDSTGCFNAWPDGNTLDWFVTIYR